MGFLEDAGRILEYSELSKIQKELKVKGVKQMLNVFKNFRNGIILISVFYTGGIKFKHMFYKQGLST